MEPPGDILVWSHHDFSDAREPTGDKVRYSYLLFLAAYVNLVTISKSTDS